MYKILYLQIKGNEREEILVHGDEKAIDKYKEDYVFPGDGGSEFDFNNQLQYLKTLEELKKEFPDAKVVHTITPVV